MKTPDPPYASLTVPERTAVDRCCDDLLDRLAALGVLGTGGQGTRGTGRALTAAEAIYHTVAHYVIVRRDQTPGE